MIGYNPSHLNTNETLLEAFHRVEAYLKANPQYQVYQSSAQYQEGTQEYTLNTIVVPEGSKVGAGDVVLFSNVYYAVIISVSETTFSIDTATNFRGTDGTNGKDGVTPNIAVSATVDNSEGTPSVEVTKSGTNENPSFAFDFHNIKGATGATGATGAPGPTGATGATPNITMTAAVVGTTGEPSVDVFKGETPPEQPTYTFVFHNLKGETGAPGPTGENGKNGTNGKNGNATYLCSAQLTQNTAAISKDAITTFPGRPIIENDIIISTAITTFGAMSQVIGQDENTVTVNFIGTLKSESGGGTAMNKYTMSALDSVNSSNMKLLCKIVKESKGKIMLSFVGPGNIPASCIYGDIDDINVFISGVGIATNKSTKTTIMLTINSSTGAITYGNRENYTYANNACEVVNFSGFIRCIYFNDTEIKL